MAKLARAMTIGVNDERPIVTTYVKEEETGKIVDLTSAVSCKFWLYPWNEDGSFGTVKVDGVAGSIAVAASGKLTYTWVTGDTDTAGRFVGYFKVYWGAASTVPETVTGIEVNIKEPKHRMT